MRHLAARPAGHENNVAVGTEHGRATTAATAHPLLAIAVRALTADVNREDLARHNRDRCERKPSRRACTQQWIIATSYR